MSQSTISRVIVAVALLCFTGASVISQTPKTEGAGFQLGGQATRIPAPEGFEEAASQFAVIKAQFTQTEAPENDMLAGVNKKEPKYFDTRAAPQT